MSALVTVAPGHQLAPDAAANYLAMLAAGCPPGITSSTRPWSVQADWHAHQGQRGYPAKADDPAKSKHVYRPGAADVGARALDLPEAAATWVRAHGAAYGWHADRVRGEWWHVEHDPRPIAVPTALEDDDMTERALIAAYREHLHRTPDPGELDPRILRIALGQSTLAAEITAIAAAARQGAR